MTTPIVPSISDEQLAELEELCGKATQGKWWIDSHGVTMMAMDSLEVVFTTPCDPKTAVRHPETGNLSNWRNDWDASYIATACPSKVQGLIARLRAAEADVERLNKIDALCEAYGCEGIHEGNRWMIDGPYRDIRAAIDDIPECTP